MITMGIFIRVIDKQKFFFADAFNICSKQFLAGFYHTSLAKSGNAFAIVGELGLFLHDICSLTGEKTSSVRHDQH